LTAKRRSRDLVVYRDRIGTIAADLDTGRRTRVPEADVAALLKSAKPGRRRAAFGGNVACALYAAVTRDIPFLEDPAEIESYVRSEVLPHARPARFKRYRLARSLPLARAVPEEDGAALGRILVARRTTREFSKRPVSFDDLSVVVRATWGQTGWIETELLGRLVVKTSPSAGAMQPLECYVLAWNVRGLPDGLFHYDVPSDALRLLRRGNFRRQAVRIASGQSWVGDAAFVCVVTAVFRRTLWKYRYENALRAVWLEAGHVAQTFALVATGRGLGPFQTAAFQDSLAEKLLGLDGVSEFPVYVLGAGVPREPAGRAPARSS
jgi:SagB-type dehydrogenase family enzyme